MPTVEDRQVLRVDLEEDLEEDLREAHLDSLTDKICSMGMTHCRTSQNPMSRRHHLCSLVAGSCLSLILDPIRQKLEMEPLIESLMVSLTVSPMESLTESLMVLLSLRDPDIPSTVNCPKHEQSMSEASKIRNRCIALNFIV